MSTATDYDIHGWGLNQWPSDPWLNGFVATCTTLNHHMLLTTLEDVLLNILLGLTYFSSILVAFTSDNETYISESCIIDVTG